MTQQVIFTGSAAGDGTGARGQVPWNAFNANSTELYSKAAFFGADSGAANAYVVALATLQPQPAVAPTLSTGLLVRFIPLNANTGPSTLSFAGGSPIAIVNPLGAALTGGEIQAQPIQLMYTGTAWQFFSFSSTGSYPQTIAEGNASVAPVSTQYAPYTAFRYLTAAQIADITAGTLTQNVSTTIAAAQIAGQTMTYQPGLYLIGSNMNLTAKILPQPGAVLWVAAGITLTVNATLIASSQIVFSGPGTTTFGPLADANTGWNPRWFGGKPSDQIPTGTIAAGSTQLTLSSVNDMEVGAGIQVGGAGAVPGTPTGIVLTNVSGTGTTYGVQIASVSLGRGISIASTTQNISSGATPNFSLTWTAVSGAVLYLIYVNGVLLLVTPNTSDGVTSTTSIGNPWGGSALPLVSGFGSYLTTWIKSVSGSVVTLNNPAVMAVTGALVRLDATAALQVCANAADLAFGNGASSPGLAGYRNTSIQLDAGAFHLSYPIVLRGMFSVYGKGRNWIGGSTLIQHAIYCNLLTIAESSAGNSCGFTFSQLQFSQENIGYSFTPPGSMYMLRCNALTTGGVAISLGDGYFDQIGFLGLYDIYLSHGGDFRFVDCVWDFGLIGIMQIRDPAVPATTKFQDVRFDGGTMVNVQQTGMFLSNVESLTINGMVFGPVYGISGNASSCCIVLQPQLSGDTINAVNINGVAFDTCWGGISASNGAVSGTVSGININAPNFRTHGAAAPITLDGVANINISNVQCAFSASVGAIPVILVTPAKLSTGVTINGLTVDMSNTTSVYAIVSVNSGGVNTSLVAPKLKNITLLGGTPASQRAIDWFDLSGEAELNQVLAIGGSYPTAALLATLTPQVSNAVAVMELTWSTTIVKNSVGEGQEVGRVSIQIAQLGGTTASPMNQNAITTPLRTGVNGETTLAPPTTTFTLSGPTTAGTGSIAYSVTCPAAGSTMASPTAVDVVCHWSIKGVTSPYQNAPASIKLA